MPKTKRSIKNLSGKSWKKEYLRILLSSEITKEDWVLANELIESGYANGTPHFSNRTAKREIDRLLWKGASTEGRLFAERLEDEIKKSSFLYKLKVVIFGITTWLMGIFTNVITSWFSGN